MHSKSDNIKVMSHNKPDEVIGELFESFHSRYQIGTEALIKSSAFIFDCVNLLHYKCHKINFTHGILYIDSPDRIKTKNNNKCY